MRIKSKGCQDILKSSGVFLCFLIIGFVFSKVCSFLDTVYFEQNDRGHVEFLVISKEGNKYVLTKLASERLSASVLIENILQDEICDEFGKDVERVHFCIEKVDGKLIASVSQKGDDLTSFHRYEIVGDRVKPLSQRIFYITHGFLGLIISGIIIFIAKLIYRVNSSD